MLIKWWCKIRKEISIL